MSSRSQHASAQEEMMDTSVDLVALIDASPPQLNQSHQSCIDTSRPVNGPHMLLFTPLYTMLSRAGSDAYMNHFDPLIQQLYRFRIPVRHVAYTPWIGYTDTHHYLLNQADAVMTVVCEPPEQFDRVSPQHIAWQMAFAERAMAALAGREAGLGRKFVLYVAVSQKLRTNPPESITNSVQTTSYDPEVAARAASHIIGRLF